VFELKKWEKVGKNMEKTRKNEEKMSF